VASETFIRRVLWVSAAFNLGGALLFAFPASLGQLLGLPVPVPGVYTALLVVFILLFGGTYAWVASQPTINRPMVALGAIGKASAFAAVFACWLAGAAPALSVVGMSGDLVLATLFASWLLSRVET
jgi:hypothetical protein